MEVVIIIIAILLAIVGVIGSVLPGPGPPLVFVAMLLLQWKFNSYSATLLWVLGALNVVLIVLDYVLPIWIGKKFGASKYGVWGSVIGMIVGIFFTPIGMMLGLFLGAVIGEYLYSKNTTKSIKAGVGTYIGTVLSIILKLGLAGYMVYQVVRGIILVYA